MSYSSAEVKSGIFVTLSLALLIVLTFIVGRFVGGTTNQWQIQFGYISGLESNAPVYFAGHEVGKVERVEVLKGDSKPILVTVKVSDVVQLREDSEAFVDTLGMMGEKFIELSPGSNPTPFLKEGTVIQGHDPIPMHQMVEKLNLLADRMDEMTQSLNPMVKRLDGILVDQEENLAKTIANFHETSQNIRDMTNDLKFRPWRLVRKNS